MVITESYQRLLKAVHIKHATAHNATNHNGADVHRNLPKKYLKLGNNYVIGSRVRIRIRVRYGVRVSV